MRRAARWASSGRREAMVRKVPVRPTPAEQCARIGVEGVGERGRVEEMKEMSWEGDSGTPVWGRSATSQERLRAAEVRGDVPWSPHPRYST